MCLSVEICRHLPQPDVLRVIDLIVIARRKIGIEKLYEQIIPSPAMT